MTSGDIKKNFTYHPPKPDQVKKYEEIRAYGLVFATLIYDFSPTSAEQTTAIRKVEEAVMWANAAIARHSE